MTAHLLILDDDQDILEMLRMVLEDEGYNLTLSHLPIMQVNEIERINPDLILLDLRFAHLHSGQEMMEMLKNHVSTCKIPLIVCSADLTAIEKVHTYFALKDALVVQKPFDLHTLLDAIYRALPPSKRLHAS